MKAIYKKYTLDFKRPSGTSRGVLTQKETWFIILKNDNKTGIGECGILRGLSIDDVPNYEEKLNWVCNNIHLGLEVLLNDLTEFPSIQFGLEQAFLSLTADNPFILFENNFSTKEAPIPINGLIWMGEESFMHQQIQQKLKDGFNCIKMKIGAIDFDTEVSLLKSIRKTYKKEEIELRVDANGAFKEDALDKLKILAELDLHSIEQPIKQGNYAKMKNLCAVTPLPIALDEELIGVFSVTKKQELLQTIQPQYIILKPSLVGGFKGAQEWISIAEKYNIGWWVTSALESNIGLNAIAQWTYGLQSKMPQGLGTGSLYTNNFNSPLEVSNGAISYRNNLDWQQNLIEDLCI
ncbi:o-succinylbenzoate synthase [Cellulophaga lytica]|uniref:Mandelate racemase/muconate lactonizing protein n=1 Tax=Cellulophaga lytica (strain ATCC 23178 / DSM 7489 / JCM 8516 / NBRC 14961 / NCIMB 1423 / VKM B-1433 / Cy l20) TaxID=867900 RepID=F0RAE8_CELLC|nr:o-succinylbenzoate synthase [Cellulophaga lytica]ADY30511.1 Mandelate racemase/muconate lactonizing protein [Cellulophaga lytica DSM 7489]AIM61502.1 mandelate racemase [Cellulophaga lytica]WQG78559.1 o-succinylbenzoate synthase [Cellulophaga lytica]